MASKLQRVPDSFFRPLMGKGFVQFTSLLQISPARMLARVVGRKEQWKVTGVQHDTEAEPLVEADVFLKNPHALKCYLSVILETCKRTNTETELDIKAGELAAYLLVKAESGDRYKLRMERV